LIHRGVYDHDTIFSDDLDGDSVAARTVFIQLRDIRRIQREIEDENIRLAPMVSPPSAGRQRPFTRIQIFLLLLLHLPSGWQFDRNTNVLDVSLQRDTADHIISGFTVPKIRSQYHATSCPILIVLRFMLVLPSMSPSFYYAARLARLALFAS
jgi:hypothetical protein